MKRVLYAFGCVLVFVAAAKDTLYPQLGAFARVLTLIEQSYIERIAPQALVERAIFGMVKSLDKYSEFIPAATYKTLRGDTPASVAHVGLELQSVNGREVVAGLLPDSPASRSGLRLGDVIAQMDGSLQGTPGSLLALTVERPGFLVPRRFSLVREPLPDIAVSVRRRGTWLIAEIRRFPDRVAKMFEETVAFEQRRGPIEGLLLDLRGNPGGLIEEAVRLLDLFLDGGTLLVTVGRDDKVLETYTASKRAPAWKMRVAVLIDAQSASAAEIVAGALQDSGRAKVYGERSFGKGSVQSIVELDDGSAVRITTALYFTPSMRKVEGQGVTPNVALSGDRTGWVADVLAR